ncbi:Syntaxin/t-SNARE family protein [Euphorbia peplus]|nr:Syntaxin/t-SNARE family protein [Euphorbia peplus]
MMVANSFDLWQKDAFFTAAEEVQESADVMQSAYRLWLRRTKEGSKLEDLDELSRDLRVALGTAKWQLEVFERAIKASHAHRSDDFMASRHKQFVTAIESLIAQVEEALKEACKEGGKKPFQWVNLNKEERDDLALFLSGTSQTSHIVKTKDPLIENRKDDIVLDVEEGEIPVKRDAIISQADKISGNRRTWSSPNMGTLKIVIADKDELQLPTIEATPKEKGSRSFFWKQRGGETSRAKGFSNPFNQMFGQVGGVQRRLQAPISCSIQFTLALMLSIFLIVPFLLYSA